MPNLEIVLPLKADEGKIGTTRENATFTAKAKVADGDPSNVTWDVSINDYIIIENTWNDNEYSYAKLRVTKVDSTNTGYMKILATLPVKGGLCGQIISIIPIWVVNGEISPQQR